MTDACSEFLAGDRPDDVVLFLSDRTVDDPGPLLEYGERVDDGVVLVMDGETGRSVFQSATEMDAMAFAGKAMRTDGVIHPDLTGGDCPKAGPDEDDADGTDEEDFDGPHYARFVFAFAEEENPDVGGRYADGDVIHAYAHCSCGAAYSQNWTAGERDGPLTE